ncbi:hypothetical protein CcCBS67573_g07544 [Chytriomyces confervae]|uniref:Uncharacterized protein n=1 Tax=Chytriomyces confervae TaxID=246404 RepID=A0A507EVP9_9FUNG|nr:hypothetical protein CcCBS67573_g07544 [Chytriomyces confervae]
MSKSLRHGRVSSKLSVVSSSCKRL